MCDIGVPLWSVVVWLSERRRAVKGAAQPQHKISHTCAVKVRAVCVFLGIPIPPTVSPQHIEHRSLNDPCNDGSTKTQVILPYLVSLRTFVSTADSKQCKAVQ